MNTVNFPDLSPALIELFGSLVTGTRRTRWSICAVIIGSTLRDFKQRDSQVRAFSLPEKSRPVPLLPLLCCKERKATPMRKEKLKANFKKDRSIPNRNTTRSENISRKQNKLMAHHAPVRRAASKARGF
jgi:hypothetical protein